MIMIMRAFFFFFQMALNGYSTFSSFCGPCYESEVKCKAFL